MRRISLLFMLFVFNLGAAAAGAQETPAADENSTRTAEVRPGELPPPEPETSPPPGEEVMQPTRRGLRLTRMMAQGIARSIAHEFPE